jgi:DNA sulfur modification protein DndB
MANSPIIIECFTGLAAHRPVLLGFASADLLCTLSFADVLNEDSGRGYQRRFNAAHSLDFRRYIQGKDSATIPLTFNLRPEKAASWRVNTDTATMARLEISAGAGKVFAQVDCQHRLGHLADLTLQLPFMSFIGLTEREEMEVFNVINGKAKGLSSSLLDFHDAQLSNDLATERPELLIALLLRNDLLSPWYRQLDLGGESTSGMTRRASFRTVQKAVHTFLMKTRILERETIQGACQKVLDFWIAVCTVWHGQWAAPRKHLLTKGIGVYALMELAAEIYLEASDPVGCDKRYFSAALGDFAQDFDWRTDGPLKGLGGEGGAKIAVTLLRSTRLKARVKVVVSNG